MADTRKDPRSAAVVAFSCRPNSGSEWGIGWNYVRMIAQTFSRVTVFVRDAEGQIIAMRDQLARENIANVTIAPVTDMGIYALFRKPAVHRRFLPIYYFLWLWRVFFLMIARGTWRYHDFIFHVTWTSDWMFSPFYLLPFRRRIVGPAGSQPANFNRDSADFYASRWRVTLKTLSRLVMPNIVNALTADAVLGISSTFLRRWPWRFAKKRFVVTQVFCELPPSPHRASDRKILFLGKHLPFKNLDLFLAAAVEVLKADPGVMVHVLGDDLGRSWPRDFAAAHGFSDRLIIHGLQPQSEVARYLGQYRSILLQVSGEAGGTVGVESLSLGVPVVCVEDNGVSAFFDGSYPYTVPYRDKAQFAAAAAAKTAEIFRNYDQASANASALAQRFTFSSSVASLQAIVADIP
jgi:glycosyltransferase involved in cell wall biosynthesis